MKFRVSSIPYSKNLTRLIDTHHFQDDSEPPWPLFRQNNVKKSLTGHYNLLQPEKKSRFFPMGL